MASLCFFAFGGLQAQQISVDQARQTAQQFLNRQTGLRSADELQLAFAVSDTTQLDAQATLRAADNGEALLYAFNSGKGGYVIAAGDERAHEVLAYGHEGTLDINDLPEGMRAMLRQYAVEIAETRADNTTIATSTPEPSYNPDWTPVEPLITSLWGQEDPYNRQTPELNGKQTVTGCPATMFAQIMDYYQYQNWKVQEETWFSGDGKDKNKINREVTVTFDSPVDWSLLKRSYKKETFTEAEGNEVAKLMKYTGAAMHIDYGVKLSGIDAYNVLNTMSRVADYGGRATYAQAWQYPLRVWSEKIYRQLAAGRPMPYASMGGGHIFLLDGYQGEGFFHFNWGWEGLEDGYFQLASLLTYEKMNIHQVGIFDCCPNTMAPINQETILLSDVAIDATGETPCMEIVLASLHSGLQTGQLMFALVGAGDVEPILSDTIDFTFTPDQNHESDTLRIPFPEYSQLDQEEYALAIFQRMSNEWIQICIFDNKEQVLYLVRKEAGYVAEAREVSMDITITDLPTTVYTGESAEVTFSVTSDHSGMSLTSFVAVFLNETDTSYYKLDDVLLTEKPQTVTAPMPLNLTKAGTYKFFIMTPSARNLSEVKEIQVQKGAEIVLTQEIALPDTLLLFEEYPVVYHLKNIGERDFDGKINVVLRANEGEDGENFYHSVTIPAGEEIELEDIIEWFG
ncbi:MAG: C10 family peptidase, partial [Parabacteroides sp.]